MTDGRPNWHPYEDYRQMPASRRDLGGGLMFLNELHHFLACLKGDEQPVVGVRDGAQSLQMALAARESIEAGKAVDLV
jgi:predicted dehydrogenase